MSLQSVIAARAVPNDINVIIEIPAHSSSIKYELDKETGMLAVDRFMPTAMHYPCNYGFIPQTLSEDGDPADVLVITPFPLQPGCLIRVRAVGMLRMADEAGEDCKILCLPTKKVCPQFAHLDTLEDVSPVLRDSIVHFFEHYKGLEPGKWVKISGWEGIDATAKEIQQSIKRFVTLEV
jgi:inorganic pyrophosphatase